MPPKTTKKTTKSEKATPKAKAPAKKKPASAKAQPRAKKATQPKTPASKAKPKATPKKTAATSKAKAPAKVSSTLDYDALLHRAREQIPPEVFDQPRFQVPEVDSFIQGTRTVIRNFKDLTDTLRRDPKHLIRFLSHELATAGEVSGTQAFFNGRFTSRALEELVAKYTEEFVVCPICHRPDTEMRREDRLLMLVCSACGGRKPLKG
ncbi:MAG: translation initiation factor IF-2 subunit beta [Promethearchaeota archaeon]